MRTALITLFYGLSLALAYSTGSIRGQAAQAERGSAGQKQVIDALNGAVRSQVDLELRGDLHTRTASASPAR